ncbi:MAG: SPOR domain-containing protein [Gemmatimonadota bacterium]|nr:SPOR domain-containing protein [Gemmatimonadota bacterium]
MLAACGGGDAPPPQPLPALAGPVSLLRLPRAGGAVAAYEPADLSATGWSSIGRLGPLKRPLGADLDERLVFAIDSAGNVVALDLESRSIRGSILSGVTTAIMSGDGSIFAIDKERRVTHLHRRSPTRFRLPLPATPRSLFGALNDRLIAVTEGAAPEVIFLAAEAESKRFPAPPGTAAATLWGDLVAIAADTAVAFFDLNARERPSSIRLGGGVESVAFSPSGHRLYVGRDRPDVVVVDRFSKSLVASIPVSSPVAAIRPDVTGRWVLLRAATGDSLWVVDATVNRIAARFATAWDTDLPTVAGPSHLILRNGADVESWDLTGTSPVRQGWIRGGAADFWILIAWVPQDRASAVQASMEAASGVQDSALVFGTLPPPVLAATPQVYLQVSSSQNPEWARELARQLAAAGHPASVRDPTISDEGYRVVVGPYPSREAAESAGRELGRPFFVLVDPLPAPPR